MNLGGMLRYGVGSSICGARPLPSSVPFLLPLAPTFGALLFAVCAGVQTQTAECLVVAEVATSRLLVVLNKVCLNMRCACMGTCVCMRCAS